MNAEKDKAAMPELCVHRVSALNKPFQSHRTTIFSTNDDRKFKEASILAKTHIYVLLFELRHSFGIRHSSFAISSP
jgi:hypothetical protein